MNAERIQDALNQLPDDMIAATDALRQQKRSSVVWKQLMPLAACFALVLGLLYAAMPLLGQKSTSTESLSGMQDNAALQIEIAGGFPETEPAAEAPAEAAPEEKESGRREESDSSISAEITLDILLTEPPKLVIRAGDQEATVGYSSASWNCEDQSFIACGVSPGSKWGGEPTLVTTEETAELTWAIMPDSITVRCWSNARSSDTWDVESTAEITGNTLTIDPEYQIYEITATWNSSESYGGTASYAVYIVCEE